MQNTALDNIALELVKIESLRKPSHKLIDLYKEYRGEVYKIFGKSEVLLLTDDLLDYEKMVLKITMSHEDNPKPF